MILDFAKKAQIGFQDPATPLAEGIVDLHNTIFFWLIMIFTPVVIIFLRIINRSQITWDYPTKKSLLKYRKESFKFNSIIHGTLLEIIWTITPTIILIAIAIPSFGLIYAMDSINDPDWTVKVIGNQWFWTYDFNFGAMLMTDIQEIYLASLKNNHQFLPVQSAAANACFTKFNKSWIQQLQLRYTSEEIYNMYVAAIKKKEPTTKLPIFDNELYTLICLQNTPEEIYKMFLAASKKNRYFPKLDKDFFIQLRLLTPEDLFDMFVAAIKKKEPTTYMPIFNKDLFTQIWLQVPSEELFPMVLKKLPTKLNVLAYTPEREKLVVEKTIQLWKHNVKNYLIDSYTLTENTENRNVRLLSTDNPLYVPTNRNIRVLLTSVDVLHSFAVPSLGVKLDATPGRLGAISIFIERPGQFFGQCSELCGVQHGFMSIEIYAK